MLLIVVIYPFLCFDMLRIISGVRFFMNRVYPYNILYPHNNTSIISIPSFGVHGFDSRENEHIWNFFNKGRPRGRGNDAVMNNN